jgi:hypothetical protein
VGADRQEGRIEAAGLHGLDDVVHLGVEPERHAHFDDARDLGVEHVAREPIGRDAEPHHAAGHRPGLVQLDRMAEAAQVIGGGQAGRAGADHQHPLAALGHRGGEPPAALDRLVAEEALDRVDADRLVDLGAIARAFARVIAHPSHHGGERIVLRQRAPGGFVVAFLRMEQPGLDVLARRTGVVAGRKAVDVDRARGAPRTGVVGKARADVERNGERMFHQASPSPLSR